MRFLKIFKVSFNSSANQRLTSLAIFAAIAGGFTFLASINAGWIKAYQFFNPCGFKQKYNISCPTCGFTHSALAFVKGDIANSFYIQPAAAVFCLTLAIIGVFALLIGVFGLKFWIVDFILAKVKIGYLILFILLIIAGGWAVTVARALMENKL